MERDTKSWIIVILLIFLILFAGAFLIKPAVTGYAIYKELDKSNISMDDYQKRIEGFRDEVSMLNANVSFYKNLNEKLLSDVKEMSKKSALCEDDLEKCEINLDKKEVKIYKEYEDLIQNIANSVCCKEKVDDPAIDSYSIKGDMIICSSKGDKAISCVF